MQKGDDGMESLQSLQVTTYSKTGPQHNSRQVQVNHGTGYEIPASPLS